MACVYFLLSKMSNDNLVKISHQYRRTPKKAMAINEVLCIIK